MKAKFIADVLSIKHKEDLFLTEVKNGPTKGSTNLLKLDAWAMKLTWKNQIHGYEIKVSRSDFLSDTKWPQYMNYCNEFSWVCPDGLIKRTEVDDRVGLIYVSEDGSMRTVKKALYRDIEIPSALYKYVLMWKLTDRNAPRTREEVIEDYVYGKAKSKDISNLFKNKMTKENEDLRISLQTMERKLSIWSHVIDKYKPFEVFKVMQSSERGTDSNKDRTLSAIESAKLTLDGELRRLREK